MMSNAIPKFRFIKKITIGSTDFNVIWDEKGSGGHFHYSTDEKFPEIVIGIVHIEKSPKEILDTIIHELLEVICSENRIRYPRPDCINSFEFHFDHRHFTTICGELAVLLPKFLKFEND